VSTARCDGGGAGKGGTQWVPRPALERDIRAIAALIPVSVRGLQAAHYTEAQMDAALGPVFGVDSQLVRDGTYFVVEDEGRVVGCGGWSRRSSLFGGDASRRAEDPALDPAVDAARIRAFFVHPGWARRGIGRCLMAACERAIRGAGFTRVSIVSTLAGEPLYAAFGYGVSERREVPLAGGLTLPVVRMEKSLSGAAQPP
jgi:predicted N-acetyltransferase YhbS